MIILITWNHGSHQVRERRLKQTSPHYMLLSFLLILKLNQKKSKTEFFNSIFVLKSSIEINFKLEYINDLWPHISPEHCTALYETHISRSSGPHHPLKNFIESKMHLQTPTSLKKKSASETVNAFFILVGLIILSKDFVIHIKLGLSILILHIQNIIQSSLSICSTHTY